MYVEERIVRQTTLNGDEHTPNSAVVYRPRSLSSRVKELLVEEMSKLRTREDLFPRQKSHIQAVSYVKG